MPAPVIVPPDGSTTAERALPIAAAIALRTGAPVHLLRVALPEPRGPATLPGRVDGPDEAAWPLACAGSHLAEEARRAAGAAGITTRATELGTDLIALSVQPRADGGVLRHGSEPSRLLPHASVPVVLSCSKPWMMAPGDAPRRTPGSRVPAPAS